MFTQKNLYNRTTTSAGSASYSYNTSDPFGTVSGANPATADVDNILKPAYWKNVGEVNRPNHVSQIVVQSDHATTANAGTALLTVIGSDTGVAGDPTVIQNWRIPGSGTNVLTQSVLS